MRRDLTSKLKDSLVRRYEMEVTFQDEISDDNSDAAAEIKYPAHTAIFNKMSKRDKYLERKIGKGRFERLLVAALKHNPDEAAELFLWAATQQSSAKVVNTFSYNLMMRNCFNSERMLQLLEMMKENDVEMDSITINTVLTRLVIEGNGLQAKHLLAEYADHDPPIVGEATQTFKKHDIAQFNAHDYYVEDVRYEDLDQTRPPPGKNWRPQVHTMRAALVEQWAKTRGLAGREAAFELLRELERRTRELGILPRGVEPEAWDRYVCKNKITIKTPCVSFIFMHMHTQSTCLVALQRH